MLLFKALLAICVVSGTVFGHHNDGKQDYKQINRDVTLKMLQTLTDDDNALVSPLLLTNSLLVLANAASGESKDEILKALNIKSDDDLEHVNLDAKHIFDIRQHLLELQIKAPITDKTEFDLLPKLMLKTEKNLKESFTKLLKENYPMDVYKMAELTDETKKLETKTINEWFLTHSKTGLMNRMLDDNDLTSDIQMLLLGGAVFKGAWKGKLFDKSSTIEADFMNADGKASTIDFMTRENVALRVDHQDKMLTLALPFTEHDDGHNHKHGTKLVLIQSTDDSLTVDNILDNMTVEQLTNVIVKTLGAPLKKCEKLSLPKMNFEKEYELKESLIEIGIKSIFDSATANFSKMIDGADLSKNGELLLDQLEHKAIVQWTEEADDSALEMDTIGDEKPISINKPFLFFILDDPNSDAMKMRKRRHNHEHAHEHDEDKHNDPMIIFAGRVKSFSKDLTFGKKDQE